MKQKEWPYVVIKILR